MELSKFKTELSKLSGINFHSPKYREIFKRYFGAAKDADESEAEETATEAKDAAAEETATAKRGEDESKPGGDNDGDSESDAQSTADDKDETTETAESGENAESAEQEEKSEPESTAEESALQELIKEDGKDSDASGEAAEETAETESEVETSEEAADQSAVDLTDELLNTKLELELVRAGIREDRLETAKRLFSPEFKASGGNAQELQELIAKYPEWITKQGVAQGFGMPLGDKADALTNEERALKRMGIDPRN